MIQSFRYILYSVSFLFGVLSGFEGSRAQEVDGISNLRLNRIQVIDQNQERIYQMSSEVAGHKLRCLLQEPSGEKPPAGWPVLLFLHGYGECGNDIEKVKIHGPPKLRDKFEALASCLIVSPQCPRESWWRVDSLRALLEEVLKDHPNIDRNRIYITGLSMGGYGTWSFISRYPDTFAAALPICGGGNPLRVPTFRPPEKIGIKNDFHFDGLRKLKGFPLWTFHGVKDTVVPIQETKRLVTVIEAAGSANVRFTAYGEAGHVAAWEQAYQDPAVWEWLFSQQSMPKWSSSK